MGSLEDLNPLAEIAADYMKSQNIKQGSSYWSHQYKKEEDQVEITIQFSTDVMLKEIHLTCIQNYYVTSGQSQFPEYVFVEIGTSLSHLIPIGKFPCLLNPNQTYTASHNSATFKFKTSQVSKYIRLNVKKPEKGVAIVISSIGLKGESM